MGVGSRQWATGDASALYPLEGTHAPGARDAGGRDRCYTEESEPRGCPMLPLTGVKVVEIANNIAGPYAGYILGLLGAEVLKVERPEGDDARGWGPPFWQRHVGDVPGAQRQQARHHARPQGSRAGRLAQGYSRRSSDVLLHNLRPGVHGRSGARQRQAMRALNPRLVYCNLSAFGPTGPMQRTRATSRWCRRSPACSPSTAIPTGLARASARRCWTWAARCGRRSAASPGCCSARKPARAAWWTPRCTRRRWGC